MMDLTLDSKQSQVLSCVSCDLTKMKLRNCGNKYGQSASPILVNNTVYRECPRFLVANEWEIGYMVSLFLEYKETKKYPFGDSLINATSFCYSLFEFLDSIYNDYVKREQDKNLENLKKEQKKIQNKKRK